VWVAISATKMKGLPSLSKANGTIEPLGKPLISSFIEIVERVPWCTVCSQFAAFLAGDSFFLASLSALL